MSRCLIIVGIVLIVWNILTPCKGVLLQELSNLEEAIGRVLSFCDNSSPLLCESGELEQTGGAVSQIRAQIEPQLNQVDEVFAEVVGTQEDVHATYQVLKVVIGLTGVAKNIPYIGGAFSAVHSASKVLDDPLKKLDDGVKKSVDSTVGNWQPILDEMLETLGFADSLISIASGFMLLRDEEFHERIEGFAEQLSTQCIRPILELPVQGFSTLTKSLQSAVAQLNDLAIKLVNALRQLHHALDSSPWKSFVQGYGILKDGLKVISEPLDHLTVLEDMLDTRVLIPYPSGIADKTVHGVPDMCKSGYSKASLYCLKDCKDGYTSDKVSMCWSKCPNGYTDVGAACENKYYKRRKESSPKMKCKSSWKKAKAKCSYNCGKKASLNPYGGCWEDCDDGWSKINFGAVGYCYKSCPNGMSLDPTRAFCNKKSYKQSSSAFVCGSGQENIGGVCYSKCKPGQTDGGLFCFKYDYLEFKISNLMDKIDDIQDKFSGTGMMKDIKAAIEDKVMKVLEPVMDYLNVPGEDQVPSIPSDFQFSNFAESLSALRGIDFNDFMNALDWMNPMMGWLDKFFSSMGVDNVENMLECVGDANDDCFKVAFGFSSPITATDWVEKVMGKLKELIEVPDVVGLINDIWEAFNWNGIDLCQPEEETTIKIPIEEAMADLMGISSSSSCEIEFDICTKFATKAYDIAKTNLESLVTKLEPLGSIIDSLQSGGSSLVEQKSSNRRGLGQKAAENANGKEWEYFLMRLPVSPQLNVRRINGKSYYEFTTGHHPFDEFLFNKYRSAESKNNFGYNVEFQARANVAWLTFYIGKTTSGRLYLRLVLDNTFPFLDMNLRKGTPIDNALAAVWQLFNTIDSTDIFKDVPGCSSFSRTKEEKQMCDEFAQQMGKLIGKGGPYTFTGFQTATDFDNIDERFAWFFDVEKLPPQLFKRNGGQLPQQNFKFGDAVRNHKVDDPFWKTATGKKIATTMTFAATSTLQIYLDKVKEIDAKMYHGNKDWIYNIALPGTLMATEAPIPIYWDFEFSDEVSIPVGPLRMVPTFGISYRDYQKRSDQWSGAGFSIRNNILAPERIRRASVYLPTNLKVRNMRAHLSLGKSEARQIRFDVQLNTQLLTTL